MLTSMRVSVPTALLAAPMLALWWCAGCSAGSADAAGSPGPPAGPGGTAFAGQPGTDDAPSSLMFLGVPDLPARAQVTLRLQTAPAKVYHVRFALPTSGGNPLDAVLDQAEADTDEGEAHVIHL